MAQAPSTISSTPGLSHTDVLWIQPLLNKVCVSADTVGFSNTSAGCDKDGKMQAGTFVSWGVGIHLLSEMWQDRRYGSGHAVQNSFQNRLA